MQAISIDLEINENGQLFAIGAVLGDQTFFRRGRFDAVAALRELDGFAKPATYTLGHNLLNHDLPILQGLVPGLAFLTKPVVDTLYLSPLAFPENPYHRLVKDYKLVRDTLNDPVADARLALGIFRDQWESFSKLKEIEPDVLAIYLYCLNNDAAGTGFAAALSAIGAEAVEAARAFEILKKQLAGLVCSTNFADVVIQYLPNPETRMALAYCVAWLRVAGGNSVLPPWVRRQFADVAPILRQLRDVPCGKPKCGYCQQVHDPVGQLTRYFDFPSFRERPQAPAGGSLQQAIVWNAMADRPVFAILPTGGGKSLCYQLPALVRYQRRGVLTIVISPLQALMKDQVDNLRNNTGSPNATALYGMLTAPERGDVLNGVRMGDIALLYVSPEQLRNRSFKEAISHREIGCWVFDEAHCLSKWGHDFRPDYLYAGRFIKEFSQQHAMLLPPVQCFTATAKEDVKAEIIGYFRRELGQELTIFEGGVERDNLHFEVQMVNRAEKLARIHEVLQERFGANGKGSAVIYCATRKNTEETAEYLQKQGWDTAAFHAGLDAPVKRHIQENFVKGVTRTICATNAFGMGIDKDDVRLVIHADIPGSLENYIQEAGRAGRDRKDAECLLFYDESDVESQFRLGSFSELSKRDIAQILRGLRSAKRDKNDDVILTTGELLRSERVDTSFDIDERNADTKVITAVAWLERAGFLERNENQTQVFQGRPKVKDLDEAKKKMASLELSKRQQERWLAILEALMNADIDAGFSADELAELSAFKREQREGATDRENETEAQRVLQTLYAMAEKGLIEKSLLLSAYVRYKVKNNSNALLEKICLLEKALLDLLPEEAPDAEDGEWRSLSLRHTNQRLCDQGYDSNPEILRNLLKDLARDGQGLAGSRGSIDLRYSGQDHFNVKLQRSWRLLRATAERRQAVAKVVLSAIFDKIPPDAPPRADLLMEFSTEEILDVLRKDMVLGSQLKDLLAALDRALMYLHEQRVITLQKGLAVFRQAMTIRIRPEEKGRRYTKGDYEPLSQHYGERVFQVHAINEYARKGLVKISQAVVLVAAYFSLDKAEFVKRYFPRKKEMLSRATGQESYQRIVDDLGNPVQQAIVSAKEEENMLVLAGPGSGKTRAVIHRCAYLLRVKRARPESVLVLCFNRNAANTLRRRLRELVGNDASRVTVQTYHGLALRLTGHSLAARNEQNLAKSFDFDALLKNAVALLQGKTEMLGVEPDEVRDRLLAGYRHILVDEYQDIDEDQYALVSAIAGRTLEDGDTRLSIMAVGDDDQNIYQFRGANIEFIRRFHEDYQAEIHYLVDNYRSTAHIIAASNDLIAANQDRMKTRQAIRINVGRQNMDAGGKWARLDPLARGCVQSLSVSGLPNQAQVLVTELKRLKQLDPGSQWSDFAVLAREWSVLEPVRALCEEEKIPISMVSDMNKMPSPFRVRENKRFIDLLGSRSEELLRASELKELLTEVGDNWKGNNWMTRLRKTLDEWQEETSNSKLPPKQAVEYICESLIEQRREHQLLDGVFLSTVHSAKGMEFKHVFVPEGGWEKAREASLEEEERRLYYVAMTRARETLCLFDIHSGQPGYAATLSGDYMLTRQCVVDENFSSAALHRRYAVLGMEDIDIGFAGRKIASDPIHEALSGLEVNDFLNLSLNGSKALLMMDHIPVAALSKRTFERWRCRLSDIETIKVLAMVIRSSREGDEKYRNSYKVDEWEIPVVEIVFRRAVDH